MRAKTSSKRAQRKIDLGEGDFVAAKQADGILGGRIDGLHDEDIFFLDNCAPGNNLDTISARSGHAPRFLGSTLSLRENEE